MRKIVSILLMMGCSLIILLAVGLWLAITDQPNLKGVATMTPAHIARAKQLFYQHDPRMLPAGAIASLSLEQADIELALNYSINQQLGGVAQVNLMPGKAIIQTSLPLPANPLGRFINIGIGLRQTKHFPLVDTFRLGNISLPGFLADGLLKTYLQQSRYGLQWQALNEMVKQVAFTAKQASITYQWQNNLPARLSGVMLSAEEQQRIAVYQQQLVQQVRGGGQHTISLTTLLQPMFKVVAKRSQNGDAIAENRAALLVLAFYINQKTFYKLLPQASHWTYPVWRQVTLSGRDDFAKHYIISALLAAYAGTPLAEAVGVFKELEDAQGGSGFSFNDIAADRAGSKLGALAIQSKTQARNIQTQLMKAQESDLMPETADLPEFLADAEFKRRFGGLEGKPYQQMLATIEKRIAALAINPH